MLSKEEISLDSVSFSKFSIVDSFGKVFFYKERVFRLINPEYASFCLELFNNGLISELVSENLIPVTTINETIVIRELPNALIIEHERLIESYIGEWTFTMLKDAACTVLKLQKKLNEKGYSLKDSHSYNILFRGTQPLWIDLGSISRLHPEYGWIGEHEFVESFFIPLKVWADGDFYTVNKLLNDKWFPHHRFLPHQLLSNTRLGKKFKNGIFDQSIVFNKGNIHKTILNQFKGSERIINVTNKALRKIFRKNGSVFSVYRRLKNIDSILSIVQKIEKKSATSVWGNYHQIYKDEISERIKSIVNAVASYQPSSVLDLAGNQGLVSRLIEKKMNDTNVKICIADYDENALDFGYQATKNESLSSNFVLINCILSGQRDNTVFERYRSDVTLALAITHHLILTQNYDVQSILETFKKFTKKYLFIEFMPLGLWSKGEAIPNLPDWYNRKWFANELKEKFQIISEEKLEENRILFIVQPLN